MLGPVLLQPRLDAFRLPQPLASEPHLRRPLLQPTRQIVAFGQSLGAPRLLQGPRFVDGRRVAPIGRGPSRSAKHAGHHGERQTKRLLQIVPHQVTPAQDHAARRPPGRQGLGMPGVILAIRHHAALRSVVAPELRRQIAGLRPRRRSPRLPLMRALQHAALRRAENQRIACAVALQRRSQGQQRIVHALDRLCPIRPPRLMRNRNSPSVPASTTQTAAKSRFPIPSNRNRTPSPSMRFTVFASREDSSKGCRRIGARRDHDQAKQLLAAAGQLQSLSRIRKPYGRTRRPIQSQDGIPAADFEHLRVRRSPGREHDGCDQADLPADPRKPRPDPPAASRFPCDTPWSLTSLNEAASCRGHRVVFLREGLSQEFTRDVSPKTWTCPLRFPASPRLCFSAILGVLCGGYALHRRSRDPLTWQPEASARQCICLHVLSSLGASSFLATSPPFRHRLTISATRSMSRQRYSVPPALLLPIGPPTDLEIRPSRIVGSPGHILRARNAHGKRQIESHSLGLQKTPPTSPIATHHEFLCTHEKALSPNTHATPRYPSAGSLAAAPRNWQK